MLAGVGVAVAGVVAADVAAVVRLVAVEAGLAAAAQWMVKSSGVGH